MRGARAVRGIARLGARLGAVLLVGCMTSKVDETRQAAAVDQANESIVILKKPQLEGVGTEEVFLDCVQERLGGELVHPEAGQTAKASHTSKIPFKIYGEQEFTDAMFPWFEPSTAPANAAGLRTLLQRPGVTERLRADQGALHRLARRQHPQDRWRRQCGLRGRAGRRRLHRRRLVGKGIRLCSVDLGHAECHGNRFGQRGRHRHIGADRGDRTDPDHHARRGARPATGSATSCARSWKATT